MNMPPNYEPTAEQVLAPYQQQASTYQTHDGVPLAEQVDGPVFQPLPGEAGAEDSPQSPPQRRGPRTQSKTLAIHVLNAVAMC